MLEKPEQIDFFAKLKPAEKAVESKPRKEEAAPTPKPARIILKKIRQDSGLHPGGRLGGWQSRYDGNLNDPENNRKWRR